MPKTLLEVQATLFESLSEIWVSIIHHIPFLIAGLIVIALTVLADYITSFIVKRSLKTSQLRYSLQLLLRRMISLAIWFCGLLVSAMIMLPELTPTKALGALGIVSIAIGLAFKDIFENFFAGVLILWRFPFQNGDIISCEGHEGTVINTTIRNTMLRTGNNELIVIPNSFLFKNPVCVLTYQTKRAVSVSLSITFDSKLDKALEAIKLTLERCKTVDQTLLHQAVPLAFGERGVEIGISWYTGSGPVDIKKSKGEVIALVKKNLDEIGIEVAHFPVSPIKKIKKNKKESEE